jgi:hypothetical protein
MIGRDFRQDSLVEKPFQIHRIRRGMLALDRAQAASHRFDHVRSNWVLN